MLRSLIEFSLRQRLLTLALTLVLAGLGVYALTSISIDAFPDLTNNQVNIITDAPGLGAAEIEQQVTWPIESAMMGLRNTEEIRSISKFGLSIITIVFPDDVNTYFARQLVSERLQEARARIPAGLQPTLGPVATAFGEVFQYLIEGPGQTAMDLRTLHEWIIKPQLRTVPGVSEINSWGGLTKQFHVLVQPERLLAYNLTLADVYQALADSNGNFGGSYVEQGAESYTVRGLGRFAMDRAGEDIGAVVIKSAAGAPVLVRDVATVEIGSAVRQGAVSQNGTGEVVSGMVIMAMGENSRGVIGRVRERIGQIQKSLPAGTRITPFYEMSALIERTTRTIVVNLLEGGALVILVLFLFLRNIRASLIVAAVIPLSMLMAFIGMKYFGVTANLMSLGAIDFGLIVDGAVVMIENFISRLEHNETGDDGLAVAPPSVIETIRAGALEVGRPILFGVTIIIAVYLPILTLQGLESRMFRPMAITICCALTGALALTMTMVPALASLTLRRPKKAHNDAVFTWLRARYRGLLEWALAWRWLPIAAALVMVIAAVLYIPRLGTEFMPELDEGALLIETRRLPSVSLTESVKIAGMVEKAVREFPEVESVVTKLGRPDLATEAMGIYQGDVYVNLHPPAQWKTIKTKEELIAALDAKLKNVPGVAYNFTQPLAMRLDEVISGVKADVAIKLFGDDFTVLEREAERVRRVLARVPGAADVQVETLGGAAELQIQAKYGEMARYGLHLDDLRRTVETAVGGAIATT
ncbi:MAG: efflux RND transporter permease subunit, partial [Blastocatellia bacterium]